MGAGGGLQRGRKMRRQRRGVNEKKTKPQPITSARGKRKPPQGPKPVELVVPGGGLAWGRGPAN